MLLIVSTLSDLQNASSTRFVSPQSLRFCNSNAFVCTCCVLYRLVKRSQETLSDKCLDLYLNCFQFIHLRIEVEINRGAMWRQPDAKILNGFLKNWAQHVNYMW